MGERESLCVWSVRESLCVGRYKKEDAEFVYCSDFDGRTGRMDAGCLTLSGGAD